MKSKHLVQNESVIATTATVLHQSASTSSPPYCSDPVSMSTPQQQQPHRHYNPNGSLLVAVQRKRMAIGLILLGVAWFHHQQQQQQEKMGLLVDAAEPPLLARYSKAAATAPSPTPSLLGVANNKNVQSMNNMNPNTGGGIRVHSLSEKEEEEEDNPQMDDEEVDEEEEQDFVFDQLQPLSRHETASPRLDDNTNPNELVETVEYGDDEVVHDLNNHRNHPPEHIHDNRHDPVDIILVATVDGTLAGLSKSDGSTIWIRSSNLSQQPGRGTSSRQPQKQPQQQRPKSAGNTIVGSTNTHLYDWKRRGDDDDDDDLDLLSSSAPSILDPLVSTTTTVRSSNRDWRTIAVPRIDGTVYLTATSSTPTRGGMSSSSSSAAPPSSSSSSTADPIRQGRNQKKKKKDLGEAAAGRRQQKQTTDDGDDILIEDDSEEDQDDLVEASSEDGNKEDHDHTTSATLYDVTVTTSVRELVDRAPFVDSRGRIYTGSRQTWAVALDGATGATMQVINTHDPAQVADFMMIQQQQKEKLRTERESSGVDLGEEEANDTDEEESASSSQKQHVIWLGRIVHSVSIFEPRTRNLDVQFSTTEMIGVNDMLLGTSSSQPWDDVYGATAAQYPTSMKHPHSQHLLSAYDSGEAWQGGNERQQQSTGSRSSTAVGIMVATPNGHVAYRNSETGQILWVAPVRFDTPVAFAIDAASGYTLVVEMVPDAAMTDRSAEYLSREMERQLQQMRSNTNYHGASSSHSAYADGDEQTIMGSLSNGQLFAMPLGGGRHRRRGRGANTASAKTSSSSSSASNAVAAAQHHHHGYATTAATQQEHEPDIPQITGRPHGHSYQQSENHQPQHQHDGYDPYRDDFRGPFGPGKFEASSPGVDSAHYQQPSSNNQISNHFPGRRSSFARGPGGNFLSETAPYQSHHHHYSSSGSRDRHRSMVDEFAVIPFLQHPPYHNYNPYYQLPQRSADLEPTRYALHQEHLAPQRDYTKLLRILGSWLPPTIALIFVVSFELGRRKRQKYNEQHGDVDSTHLSSGIGGKADSAALTTTTELVRSLSEQQVGVIQVNNDVILGYGAHGTVVFLGQLEGRQVAVKRMLRAYHASADREISLLIESDGHPNVVRYFFKEVRGDFVYLALELCDLSMHDLIATLRIHVDAGEHDSDINENRSKAVSSATRTVLFQIACGVRHLHHLRIVHRDLKPANILLAESNKTKKRAVKREDTAEDEKEKESVYDIFQSGRYVAKISDMGLGKQLVGQSSYGASLHNESSLRGLSHATAQGGASSIAGVGPGSVGWQAPEVMALRAPSDTSVRPEHSNGSASNDVSPSPDANPPGSLGPRTSRSVDIFSLGCIFYSTLMPGHHPFGEWYEREANIMHYRPNMQPLRDLCLDAFDLVSAMIHRQPNSRPTAKQICEHPFFWSPERRLAFLCDFSDRVEIEAAAATDAGDLQPFITKWLAVERGASAVVGISWDRLLDDGLVNNVQRFRTYDTSSVRDLLRLIRNKHHHFEELPNSVKLAMNGSNQAGLMEYFEARFPTLLLHCVHRCREILPENDHLNVKYSIAPMGRVGIPQFPLKRLVSMIPETNAVTSEEDDMEERQGIESFGDSEEPLEPGIATNEETDTFGTTERRSDAYAHDEVDPCSDKIPLLITEVVDVLDDENKQCAVDEWASHQPDDSDTSLTSAPDQRMSAITCLNEVDPLQTANEDEVAIKDSGPAAIPTDEVGAVNSPGDVVLWYGSTAAKSFGCRGWYRSDDEWERTTVPANKKRDALLQRFAEDPKFRTRLCNHWDSTFGAFCPMRKRNKCVFAHGPVELRVKENKRNRWGKLVDAAGDNNNPRHSGGEDTYGAAKSIETERKHEGKWNTETQQPGTTNNTPQQKGKKQGSSKKKSQTQAGP